MSQTAAQAATPAASPFGAPPVVVQKGMQQQPLVVGGMQVQGQFEPVKDRWSSGICDCFQDCATCLAACCCPFIAIGQLYERVLKVPPSCTPTRVPCSTHCCVRYGAPHCLSRRLEQPSGGPESEDEWPSIHYSLHPLAHYTHHCALLRRLAPASESPSGSARSTCSTVCFRYMGPQCTPAVYGTCTVRMGVDEPLCYCISGI